MELVRGITGFRDGDDPPLPECDVAAFHAHCRTAARVLNGRMTIGKDVVQPAVSNFTIARLELPRGPVAVLLNLHFPVVAFAQPSTEGEVLMEFIDAPRLAEAFRRFGVYELPDLAELAAPLTMEHKRNLSNIERRQLNYWRAERVGDVVFNCWD